MYNFIIWFAIYFCCYWVQASHVNFQVVKFTRCNATQGLIKFQGNITKENGEHFLNADANSPIEWGENLGIQCRIETRITENYFVELFTVREKNICKAGQMYMGEFWYDVVTHTGCANSRSCPLPPGRYHVNHLKLNFNKLTLQTFPFGRLRFFMRAIDNINPNRHMMCLMVEVENVLN